MILPCIDKFLRARCWCSGFPSWSSGCNLFRRKSFALFSFSLGLFDSFLTVMRFQILGSFDRIFVILFTNLECALARLALGQRATFEWNRKNECEGSNHNYSFHQKLQSSIQTTVWWRDEHTRIDKEPTRLIVTKAELSAPLQLV